MLFGDPFPSPTFKNEFDLIERKLSEITIKETVNKDKCIVWDQSDSNKAYNSFLLDKNSKSKIICEISFYKSSETQKYIPRPIFKRLSLENVEQISSADKKVIISLNKSNPSKQFWKLITFLSSYKEIVDFDNFKTSYKVVPKDSYIIQFKNQGEKEKLEDLKELINLANLSTSEFKYLTFESRKQNLKAFYYLLKNKVLSDNTTSHETYREKYSIRKGEEYIWHHFLKTNDWILGLNADVKFIQEFLDEQKVGNPTSKGRQDPQVDILGISDFTVLIELKHTKTNIFKFDKSKGRANTWDFTSDFIEGISQCLGQKFEFDKSFDSRSFEKDDATILDKSRIQSVDPISILIIGNKKREFPVKDLNSVNLIKGKTLERFRRNNRNITVLTYDELFERAYHIVYSKKLGRDWFEQDEDQLFN